MTRYTRLIQAIEAARDARAPASALLEPELMRFVVFEDDGGRYQWTIVDGSGDGVVQSASFASYEDAKAAARAVHAGAGSALFEECASVSPPADLARPPRQAAGARRARRRALAG